MMGLVQISQFVRLCSHVDYVYWIQPWTKVLGSKDGLINKEDLSQHICLLLSRYLTVISGPKLISISSS